MHNLPRPQSLVITLRGGGGIFELIIKKCGDERSDGKERKSEALFSLFPSHRSPLALCPHSYHPPLAFLAFLQLLAFLASSCSVLYTKPWERLWRRHLHDKVIMLLSPVTFSLRLNRKGGLEDCRQFLLAFD